MSILGVGIACAALVGYSAKSGTPDGAGKEHPEEGMTFDLCN